MSTCRLSLRVFRQNFGVLAFGLALLTGCATRPYQAQPLAPDATAAALSARSLQDEGLRTFLAKHLGHEPAPWPLPAWDFETLSLAAFYYQPSLDVARARWAVARAGNVTAGERPNPTLGVGPGYNTTTSTPSPWIFTLPLDLPIETAGKRGHRIASAAQLSEAARLNIASAAWQVRSRVRKSLVDLFAARETEALLREQQTIQAENVRLLELQFQAGAISAFELTQARLAADGARLAWRDTERQSLEARGQLAEAIGIPARALEGVELSFAGFGQLPGDVPAADARRQALLNRADVLGALAEYAASQSALQLEIARQYPDLHLSPGYEYDQGDNKWSLGLSVTLPILNQNRGPIAEAEARRAEAAATFNALQAGVLAEIDRAVAGYRVALQRQADADALLVNLRKQENAARAIFAAGEISRSELAGLQLQLNASALARLDALVKAQQAAGQLEDALQSPLGLPASVWQNSPRISETSPANPHP